MRTDTHCPYCALQCAMTLVRDDDAGGYAGRLVDNLEAKFGPDRVMHDKTRLQPGADWR